MAKVVFIILICIYWAVMGLVLDPDLNSPISDVNYNGNMIKNTNTSAVNTPSYNNGGFLEAVGGFFGALADFIINVAQFIIFATTSIGLGSDTPGYIVIAFSVWQAIVFIAFIVSWFP